jgi:uncharacterized protein HemY
MKRETKKAGRRANQDERFIAEVLVDVYQKALEQPDGMLTLNNENNPEDQCLIDSSDIKPLLDLLDNFAKHGTFKSAKIPLLENIAIRKRFEELRSNGMKYSDAVQQLAEENNMSVSTIERRVSKNGKPGELSSLL